MTQDLATLAARLASGQIVPYLGPGALLGVTDIATGEPIPAEGESLILAMNGGKPMAPKLMYEFPRAAMNQELKKGRAFVNRFLIDIYAKRAWTTSPLHTWLGQVRAPYVIDINRDLLLQQAYAAAPHLLIRGLARIGGTDYRFRIDQFDGKGYHQVTPEAADRRLPIVFKPMGSPQPFPETFIASDADYVDYITELMGGFGLPHFLKERRQGMQYLFIGLRMNRDTERMVLSDIIYSSGEPAGWALIPEPNAKERRFCANKGIEIVEAGLPELMAALGIAPVDAPPAAAEAA